MSNFNVRFPDALYEQLKTAAEGNHTSVNQFIVMAVAKEVGRHEVANFYQRRIARSGSADEFQRLLNKAPDVEPELEDDRLGTRTHPG